MTVETEGLRGLRVLVVEDSTLVAMTIVDELEQADAFVIGPADSVGDALAHLDRWKVEAAILDVELQGEAVYPVADVLLDRGVPFVFTTGHDADILPPRYAAAPCSTKPTPASEVVAMLAACIAGQR